jgi:hypothetical protein
MPRRTSPWVPSGSAESGRGATRSSSSTTWPSAFAVVVTLWGAERIARRLDALLATTSRVLDGEERDPFRGVNSVVGPVVASAVTAAVFAGSALVQADWAYAALRGPTWFVLGIAIWSFLWTYGSLQLGLHRLGQARLIPEAGGVDPTLGLRPLGDVAFMGLWMLLVWLVPLVLTGLPDVVGLVIGLLVLSVGFAAFFLSLTRLHRQMVAVKATEVAIAQDLYARAYEPVRETPTLDTLERQHSLLGAADALDKRADAIHEWPLGEGTVARVITIVTSVIAMMIGRIILDPLGL